MVEMIADLFQEENVKTVLDLGCGMIFVDYVSKQDSNYGRGTPIEKDTFINNTPGEEDIPHHYTDAEELSEIYSGHKHSIKPYMYSFCDDQNNTHHIEALLVVCRK